MRAPGSTLVFVEVRQRAQCVTAAAPQHRPAANGSTSSSRRGVFLMRKPAACRFERGAGSGQGGQKQQGVQIEWLKAAFDAG
jgi:Holliday junction resolvase-like predicted endonuclease